MVDVGSKAVEKKYGIKGTFKLKNHGMHYKNMPMGFPISIKLRNINEIIYSPQG